MSAKKILCLLLAVALMATCLLTGCKSEDDPEVLAKKARKTVAITVGDHKINAVTLNYYFVEVVSSFCNSNSTYLTYLLSLTTPLNEQSFGEETGQTWADYFLEIAKSNIKGTYLLYDAALEAGAELSVRDEATLASVSESIEYYAEYYGYSDTDAYLVSLFGYGADLESYLEYYRMNLLADTYYMTHFLDFSYDDAALREYEAKDPLSYNSYSYAYYYLPASAFQADSVEEAAALAAAKAAADSIASGTYADTAAFDAALASLEAPNTLSSTASTVKSDLLYADVNSQFQEWLGAEGRAAGEVGVIAKTATVDDVTTTDGYYIVLFNGVNDNTFALKNVRHALISFDDNTSTANAAAKEVAEALMEQWLTNGGGEDAFAQLANEHSVDSDGTDGGLYEDIYPGQMVTAFEEWCYDSARKSGDYGIVETEYGYHIMYFVGNSDTNYRDYMISMNKRSEEMDAWYADLLDSTALDVKTLEFVPMDMTLSG